MTSSRLVALVVGAFVALSFAAVPASSFVACAPEQSVCTPESTGHGGQRTLTRRDLPGVADKPSCNPHVEALSTADDLRRAYEAVGQPISDPDGGVSAPGAIALPAVDFTTESVILREDTDGPGVAWMVVTGSTATVGTQGCVGAGTGTCVVKLVAVDALLTKADGYSCEDIKCGGGGLRSPTSGH
jgi:hypothetical protein